MRKLRFLIIVVLLFCNGKLLAQCGLLLVPLNGDTTQTVCNGTAIDDILIQVNGLGAGTLGIVGLPTGLTTSIQDIGGGISILTISGTPTVTGVFPYTIINPTCNAVITGTITINTDATLSLSSAPQTDDQSVCINTPITNITYLVGGSGTDAVDTGLPSGLIGVYDPAANTYTISGTPDVAGTYTYTVTASGPCNPSSLNGTIEVLPVATVTSPMDTTQTVCIGTSITDITFSIGPSVTNAIVNGLPTSITSLFNAGVLTISGTATQAGTFPYTIQLTGCGPSSTPSGTITVNDPPIITDQITNVETLCLNDVPTALSVSATGTNISYQWYSNVNPTNTGGTLIGAATNSTYTPLINTTGTLYYYCVVTGTCSPAVTSAVSGAITVAEPPTITAQTTNAQTICENSVIALSVTATGSNLTYQWYSNVNPINSAGVPISGATNPAYTPTAGSGNPVYYYCVVSGICSPPDTSDVSGAIIINPVPTGSILPVVANVCQYSALPAIIFTGPVTGIQPYTFGYNINGPSNPLQTITTNGTNLVSVYAPTTDLATLVYNLVSVTDGNGCTADLTESATINIVAAPSLSGTKDTSVCDNTSFDYITPVSDAINVSWTRASALFINNNLPASGIDAHINELLQNSDDQPHEVNYAFTLVGTGCTIADTIKLRVNPTPKINPVTTDTVFCNHLFVGEGIRFTSNSPDSSFTWVSDNPIGFGTNGIGSISPFIANNTGNSPFTAILQVSITASADHCPGPDTSFTITVNPTPPLPNFSSLSDYPDNVILNLCNGSNNINFNVNAPVNGVEYSWTSFPPGDPGIMIRDLNDANTVISFTATGDHMIQAIATDNINGGCRDTISQVVNIGSDPGFDERKIILKQPGNLLFYPDNSMNVIDGYQWGYDSIVHTANDPTYSAPKAVEGQVYQFFVPADRFILNNELDTGHYAFWVLLTKGDCKSRVYYNGVYANRHMPVFPTNDNTVQLNVFPNPNNGIFTIGLSGNIYGSIDAKIYNATGQVVYGKRFIKTTTGVNESFRVINLPAGLYYLSLNSSDLKKVVARFVIQH